MFRPQEFIHRLEQGSLSRVVQMIFIALLIIGLAVAYNLRSFRNMSSADAMSAAQLARNLSEGRGFVTDSITPLSMHLVKERNAERIQRRITAGMEVDATDYLDESRLRNNHPDLAHAPLYPWLLSWYMKVLPFEYDIPDPGAFSRYQPDLLIAILNQVLLVLCAVMAFLLAATLFDSTVAWLSTILFVGTEMYWRFSASGNSTMLLLLIFLVLLWLLARLERGVNQEEWVGKKPIVFAALLGLVVGLGFLTRYAFGWVLIPVAVFVIIYGGRSRLGMTLTLLAVCALVVTPWIQRNNRESGTLFGTAGYAVHELTNPFPGNKLQRSLEPNMSGVQLRDHLRKLRGNTKEIIEEALPRLGGTWLSAFFLVGLLIFFQDPHRNRMRGFVLLCLAMFVMVQALGKTQLSVDSPTINTENLLALLGPAVIIFGVSVFLTLIDRWNLPTPGLRWLLTGMFAVIASLPLLISLTSRSFPIAYPPYYPPVFQMTAGWLRPNEQMMSDVPSAVAWYGDRQCLLWTLDPEDEFYAIYDYQKPINALYLSPGALDQKFLTGLMKGPAASWGVPFLVNAVARVEIPPEFPLKYAPRGGFLPRSPQDDSEEVPEHFFLADRIRW